MLLIVVRSIVVYGAAAAAGLWLAHRFVQPLPRRAALALAVLPWLFTGPATFTGAIYAPLDIAYDAYPLRALRTEMGMPSSPVPTLGDVVYQGIPWRQAVRESVRRGELPLWNPHVLSGEPLLAVQQPALFHPGTWVGFLLPLAQAWTFEMSLRLFLALLCGYLFFREIGLRDPAVLLGAAGWAFSNYVMFFLGYPLTPAVAPFPLLLLGLRRLARGEARAVGIVAASLLLTITSGHPETLLHGVAAAGLYFLWELSRVGRRAAGRAVLRSLGAGALTLGLSAVLLLPLAEALPHTWEQLVRTGQAAADHEHARPWKEVVARLAFEVSPLGASIGGPRPWNDVMQDSSGYCGALLLPLALTGLCGRGRDRWFFLAVGALALSISAYTPAADWIARLPLFEIAINDRLVFVTAFSVCFLAALGANRLLDGEGRAAFLWGSAATCAGLAVLFVRCRLKSAELGLPDAEGRDHFLMQVLPVLGGVAAVALLGRGARRRAAVLALLGLLLVQRRLEAGWFTPSVPSRAFSPRLPVLEGIPRREPWRFVSLGYTFIPNIAAMYGLEDVRGYEAMTFRPMLETFPMWCIHQSVWFNRVTDPTRPFLSFLNARWVLSPDAAPVPAGWTVLSEGQGMRLIENPSALPRAFVPGSLLGEPDPARRLALLGSIDDFAARGVLSEPSGSAWTRNGAADVKIVRYAADRLGLEVNAAEPAVVATSIPSWPGWRISLGGRSLPIVAYNHGFVAFRVPAGRHRVELRYLSASVVAGAAISLLSVVAAGLLARRSAAR